MIFSQGHMCLAYDADIRIKLLCFKTYQKSSLTTCTRVVLPGFFPSGRIPYDITGYSTSIFYNYLELNPVLTRASERVLIKNYNFPGDSKYSFKIHF